MGKAVRPKSDMRWEQDEARKRGPSRIVWSSIGAAVATVLFLILRIGADPAPPGEVLESIPAYAIGTWETSNPRYSGRLIFVMEEQVLLDRGVENEPDGGRVIEARGWTEEDALVVRFEFLGLEGRDFLEAIFQADGSMHLRNPEDVLWRRRTG